MNSPAPGLVAIHETLTTLSNRDLAELCSAVQCHMDVRLTAAYAKVAHLFAARPHDPPLVSDLVRHAILFAALRRLADAPDTEATP